MKVGPFEVKYELGHSYQETWEHDEELFCPGCGVKEVFVEDSEGDYYLGPTHHCRECGLEFALNMFGNLSDWQSKQRNERLKGATCPNPPTTSKPSGETSSPSPKA